MDGLPPPPAPVTSPAGMMVPSGLPQMPGDNYQKPVGRPSNDPAADEDRRVSQELRRRLQSVLPRESTDSRISVYKFKRNTNIRSPRSFLKITLTELEDAVNSSNADAKEYVTSKIAEKFGNSGRFLCVPEDNKGATLPKFSPWEVNLDQDQGGSFMGSEFDEDYDQPSSRPFQGAGTPPPPSSAAMDPGALVRDMHEVISGEHERTSRQSGDTMALVMTMMQNQTQTMMATLTANQDRARAEDERRREEENRREERRREEDTRRREDDLRREERERDRRNDLFKVLIPIVAPVIVKLTEGKPDVTMPLLLDMIKNGQNNNSAKDMISMVNESAKQQIALQGEVSRQAMASSSEVNKNMMAHVLTLSQDMTKAMMETMNEPSDDPMEKFGRIARTIIPLIQQAGQPPAPPMGIGPMLAPAAMDTVAAMEHQSDGGQAQPAQSPAAVAPPATDGEKIRSCLYTLLKLEQNMIPANERVWALDYVRKNMPPEMLSAVAAGQQDRILELAHGVVMQDQQLMQWVSQDKVADFVMDAIKDVQRLTQNDIRMSDAQKIVGKQVAYIKARGAEPKMSQKPAWSADPVEAPRRRARIPTEDSPAAAQAPAPVPPQAPAPDAVPAPVEAPAVSVPESTAPKE